MDIDEFLIGLVGLALVFLGPVLFVVGLFIGGWGLVISFVGLAWWLWSWGKLD